MQRLLPFFILLFFLGQEGIAQEPVPPPPPPPPPPKHNTINSLYRPYSKIPLFPGCESSDSSYADRKRCADQKLLHFVYSNVCYPKLAHENNIEGTVVVQFMVERDGKITHPKIVRDIGGKCGEEALRVIKIMQQEIKWIPGEQNGEAIAVQFNLPIKFRQDTFTLNRQNYLVKPCVDTVTTAIDKNRCALVPPPPIPKVVCGFKVVESMPRFPGCEDVVGNDVEKQACADELFQAFLAKNLRWPGALQDTGRVWVQFTVQKDSAVADIKLLKDIGGRAGQEALRVVNLMKKKNIRWIPGKQRGRLVDVTYRLPIRFAKVGTVRAAKRQFEKVKKQTPKLKTTESSPKAQSLAKEVKSAPAPFSLEVFPNPATDAINIMLEGSTDPIKLRLFNMLGQQLWQQQVQPVRGKVNTQLRFDFDDRGMLLLQVEQAGKVHIQKVLRQ